MVAEQVTQLSTSLTQTINSIVSEALASYVTTTELETIKENISSTVTQTAEDLKLEFNNSLIKTTEEINGTISSELTELKAYIRGYMNDDGQPVVELGSSNSNIILKIVNDRISFTENGIEVAYIADDQLYITNATILNELRIGNMAFKRRKNGNLSLVMIGG
jgi:hypothetical protein